MRAYLIAACLAAPTILRGQAVEPRLVPILTSSVGSTARVTVDSGNQRLTGVIERVRGDTLILVSESGGSQTLAVQRITRLDIREPLSAGDRLHGTRVAMVRGLLIGAAIGYAIAVPRARHAQQRGGGAPYQEIELLSDPIIGGLAGLVIGSASAKAGTEEWVPRYP